jgi:hypothetical protein
MTIIYHAMDKRKIESGCLGLILIELCDILGQFEVKSITRYEELSRNISKKV